MCSCSAQQMLKHFLAHFPFWDTLSASDWGQKIERVLWRISSHKTQTRYMQLYMQVICKYLRPIRAPIGNIHHWIWGCSLCCLQSVSILFVCCPFGPFRVFVADVSHLRVVQTIVCVCVDGSVWPRCHQTNICQVPLFFVARWYYFVALILYHLDCWMAECFYPSDERNIHWLDTPDVVG